jgi:hypothetical protein
MSYKTGKTHYKRGSDADEKNFAVNPFTSDIPQ